MQNYRRNAVCLVSGGVDSITTVYYVVRVVNPPKVLLIHANYGQRMAEYERWCAAKASEDLAAPLKEVDLRWLGRLSTSMLVRDEQLPETPVESLWDPEKARDRILRWWDVVRNLQLITVGLAHAESFDLTAYLKENRREPWDVYIGIRRETPVAMKDNTPEFIEEMNRVAEVSTHFGGYRVHAPLINLDKDAVVKLGQMLNVPWIYTYSCYQGAGWSGDGFPIHCGTCSNCRRRYLGFKQAGIPDPSLYLKPPVEGEFRQRVDRSGKTYYVDRRCST
ncbi:MAG: 7-cyano-7-deazaguanine synthase [Candidatus Caldarchaeum sp.]|nr:7-cyano-7-deazaguanine synthase [Candidatus Caldarchaeum sp.]